MNHRFWKIVGGWLLVSSAALAERTDLSLLEIGNVIHGPEAPLKDLAGKVVLVDFWGRKSKDSLQAFPKMVALQQQFCKYPFRLIGIQSQPDGVKADLVEQVKGYGVEYTIAESGSHPKVPLYGIPFLVVFDHTGTQVYKGNASGAVWAAKKAILSHPELYLGEAPYAALKPLAKKAAVKNNLAQVWSAAHKKLESGAEAERAEAERLIQALTNYRELWLEVLEEARWMDLLAYREGLERLKKELSDDKGLGAPVAEKLSALREAPDVAQQMKGFQGIHKVQETIGALPSCMDCRGRGIRTIFLECPHCRKRNEEAFVEIRKDLLRIEKKYSRSPAGDRAEEVAKTIEKAPE